MKKGTKIEKSTMKARGCQICIHRISERKYEYGTHYDYYCKFDKCPYAELDKIENYAKDTKKETREAESRANVIVKKMIRLQGE